MNFACEKIAYPKGGLVDRLQYLAVMNQPRLAYNKAVAEISVAGRRNPLTLGALWRINNAFSVHGPSMAGDAGQSVRAGRVPSSRFPTPASFATIPVGRNAANAQPTRSFL